MSEGELVRYHNFVWDSARWEGFVFRDDDIVISTAPKCGTTWMQMLCALLILRTPQLGKPLASVSPWIDMCTRPLPEVRADLDAQTHRRFIKTHTPLDGLPFDERVTYLHVARDPRDAALSMDSHLANMDMDRFVGIRVGAVGMDDFEELGITGPPPPPPEDPAERFWAWIESDPSAHNGLPALVHHVETFWERRDEPNIHLFHYADLRADLAGQMRRLAGILGVEPPTDELIAAGTFEAMKAQADELIPNSDTSFWKNNREFFAKARSGDWRELLAGTGEARYEKAVTGLADADLLAWLHGGGPAVS